MDSIQENVHEIYKFQFMPSDLHKIYNEILREATVDSVFDTFSNYVVEHIEPVGWKGLWIPTSDECSNEFIVKVTNVLQTLEASVVILRKHTTNSNVIDENGDHCCSTNNDDDEKIVPLKELFVITDDEQENLFHKTAFIIEIVRFFYNNLWRPWDDLDENNLDENFSLTRLLPRLNLIFDIKTNLLSQKLINRYETILSESTTIRKTMDQLKKSVTNERDTVQSLDMSEGEIENDYANELDAFEYIGLKLKLENYQREMKFIEDPNLRIFYDTFIPEPIETSKDPTLHLISLNFNAESLSKTMNTLLSYLDSDKAKWPIKLYNSFQKTLRCSKSGDCIYLDSGIYSQSLSWIENDIEIYGLKPNVELWSNKDCGDMFLFINVSKTIKINNIKIKAGHSVDQLILIKSGHLILENCILDCNHLAKEAILRLNNAQLTLVNTEIIE